MYVYPTFSVVIVATDNRRGLDTSELGRSPGRTSVSGSSHPLSRLRKTMVILREYHFAFSFFDSSGQI